MAWGLSVGWINKFEKKSSIELIKNISPTINDIQVNSKVTFDIAGAIVKPGMYSLDRGSRVGEALVLAGGLSASADRDWVEKNVNKAEVVGDEMKIYIPKAGETELKAESLKIKGSEVVNLNSATLEELDKLPGVGPAIAGRIIDYREKNGGFRNVEELKLVKGIGDKMFEEIKDQIGL